MLSLTLIYDLYSTAGYRRARSSLGTVPGMSWVESFSAPVAMEIPVGPDPWDRRDKRTGLAQGDTCSRLEVVAKESLSGGG